MAAPHDHQPENPTRLCNICGQEIAEGQPIVRAYSGRHPYEHANPKDCRPREETNEP